jgi:hypothetical protein
LFGYVKAYYQFWHPVDKSEGASSSKILSHILPSVHLQAPWMGLLHSLNTNLANQHIHLKQINDSLVEEMQSAGVDIDQSLNSDIYTWEDWGFPSNPVPMDKDGKWVEEIAMEESLPALKFTMTALDSAGNLPLTKEYFFVKEGTPVTYAKRY